MSSSTTAEKSSAYTKAIFTRDVLRAAGSRRVSAPAQALLAVLTAEAWWDRKHCAWFTRTSQSRLAERLSLTPRSVRRLLCALIDAELVTTKHAGNGSPARYFISCPKDSVLLSASVQADTGDLGDRTPVTGLRGHACPPRTPVTAVTSVQAEPPAWVTQHPLFTRTLQEASR